MKYKDGTRQGKAAEKRHTEKKEEQSQKVKRNEKFYYFKRIF